MDQTIRYVISQGYDVQELIQSGITKQASNKEPYLLVDIL